MALTGRESRRTSSGLVKVVVEQVDHDLFPGLKQLEDKLAAAARVVLSRSGRGVLGRPADGDVTVRFRVHTDVEDDPARALLGVSVTDRDFRKIRFQDGQLDRVRLLAVVVTAGHLVQELDRGLYEGVVVVRSPDGDLLCGPPVGGGECQNQTD